MFAHDDKSLISGSTSTPTAYVAQRDLLRVLLSRWRLILLCGLIGLLIGVANVLFTDTAYRAEVLVAPVIQRDSALDQLGAGLGIGAMLDLVPGASGNNEAERTIATLTSTQFSYRFITKNKLAQELFPERWDSDSGTWRPHFLAWLPMVPDGPRAPTQLQLVSRLASMRSVSLDKPSGLVRIRLDWPTAARAADLANAMVSDFNEFSRAQALAEARRAMEYLERESASANVAELRVALARLIEEQMKREMMATVQPEFALRVVDPAVAPDKSVRPRYVMTPALWVLALMGVAVAYVVAQAKHS
ncbi:MAG: hypothetical protein IRZ28_05865 [Steroidobacteraceae bacterium]|nr:hypothetical protein [Steroidobacteraceae bacterium]